jgi:hypothetical protein
VGTRRFSPNYIVACLRIILSDPQTLVKSVQIYLGTEETFLKSLYNSLSSDGILVASPLGILPFVRFIESLLDLGFERIRDYEEVRMSW